MHAYSINAYRYMVLEHISSFPGECARTLLGEWGGGVCLILKNSGIRVSGNQFKLKFISKITGIRESEYPSIRK